MTDALVTAQAKVKELTDALAKSVPEHMYAAMQRANERWADEYSKLEDALAEAQKDAGRYRWLRQQLSDGFVLAGELGDSVGVDAAIDVAITAQTSASPPPASEDVRPG